MEESLIAKLGSVTGIVILNSIENAGFFSGNFVVVKYTSEIGMMNSYRIAASNVQGHVEGAKLDIFGELENIIGKGINAAISPSRISDPIERVDSVRIGCYYAIAHVEVHPNFKITDIIDSHPGLLPPNMVILADLKKVDVQYLVEKRYKHFAFMPNK